MGPLAEGAALTAAPEAPIWIEVLSRHHEVLARHRCAGPVARIGRGYANDVVLDDPHIAANHLLIRRGAGGRLVAEDLGSLNGLRIDGRPASAAAAPIDGNSLLHIGSTWLRVRTAADGVLPEPRLQPQIGDWPVALALAALVSGTGALSNWLDQTTEPRLSEYVKPLLLLVTLALVWTTAWAFTSRIFGGTMRYGRHLLIAFAAMLALYALEALGNVGSYALSWGAPDNYAFIPFWLLVGVTCIAHLRTISTRHPHLKNATVLLLVVVGIAVQFLSQSDERRVTGPVIVVHRLEPPFLRMARPVDDTRFFADAASLKGALERARRDEHPAAAADPFDSDDDD